MPFNNSVFRLPNTSALVVEGGAMRGIFASGVLDFFMQHNYRRFDFAIGVSAGATNLSGYVCNQPGRSHDIIVNYATQREFFNPLRGLKGVQRWRTRMAREVTKVSFGRSERYTDSLVNEWRSCLD